MTGTTVLRKRVGKIRGMARVARQIFMTLWQCRTGFGFMVESFGAPQINRMAARTVCAEAALVNIISAVATLASTITQIAMIGRAMTCSAGKVVMAAQ